MKKKKSFNLRQWVAKPFARRKVHRKNKSRSKSRALLVASPSRRGSQTLGSLLQARISRLPETIPAPISVSVPVPLPAPATSPVETKVKIAVPVETPPPKSAKDGTHLSTQDLIQPEDPLRDAIEAFLLDQRSPHTQRAYSKDLKRFIKFLLVRKQNYGAEPINRMTVIAYKDWLLVEKLQHTTVDRHLATLRSFFGWLVEEGLMEKNPAEKVRFLKPKRLSKTIGFTDEEVKKILALPNLHTRTGAQHYAILMVLFFCGLRRSELCALRTKNLGEERGHRILRLTGKGNQERLIPLIPAVWNAIRYYLFISGRNLSEDHFLFAPIRNNRSKTTKRPLDPSMIFYIVTRYARLSGISNKVSPHSCRATAISNARDHNVSDRAIQEFAGWSSTDMITRYDKRKTSIENSAAHAITYGEIQNQIPKWVKEEFETEDNQKDIKTETDKSKKEKEKKKTEIKPFRQPFEDKDFDLDL